MRTKLVTLALAAAIGLGACDYGGGSDDATTAPAGATGDKASTDVGAGDAGTGVTNPGSASSDDGNPVAPPATGGNIVRVGQTDLGEVLTNTDGLTLYGLTEDTDGVPTCEGACAETWPPLLVESMELPAGLDPATFSVVHRSDGTHQLAAGPWPLYTFAGDEAPGDTNGQGSGGVWFAVAPDGRLIQGNAGGAGAESGDEATPAPAPADEPADDGSDSADDGYGNGSDYGYGDDSSSESSQGGYGY